MRESAIEITVSEIQWATLHGDEIRKIPPLGSDATKIVIILGFRTFILFLLELSVGIA
jgi:hypothetical protein